MTPETFQISTWDILIFVAFVITVVTVGMIQSRKEDSSEDYFLAGRGLTWWLIGFSLIASNISTEQFVGMSGNAASHVGLAIAMTPMISDPVPRLRCQSALAASVLMVSAPE